MPTKTISLEIDAYERLRSRKRHGESFSAVVRRAEFPDTPCTGGSIREALQTGSRAVSEADLRAIEEADQNDSPPADPWQ